MNHCKFLNVILVIKKIVELTLGIGFLVLSSLALKDLLSNETTQSISRKHRNASLPSFTVCPFATDTKFLNSTSLANGAMTNLHFPLSVIASLQSKITGTFNELDLLNSTHLLKDFNTTFEETWTMNCKIFPSITKLDSCIPCITSKNPTIKGAFDLIVVSLFE